jgi:MFS family permease
MCVASRCASQYRAIAGIGLGGECGIGMALAAEAWPSNKRARVSSYVMVGWHGGVLLAAFVTAMLLPVIGWRGMFLLGILPALVAFVVRRTLDEPEIFVKKHATRSANSFRFLVKDEKILKTTLGIAVLWTFKTSPITASWCGCRVIWGRLSGSA